MAAPLYADECITISEARPTLTGTAVITSTTHFRIHYTLSGADSTTYARTQSVASYAEEVYSVLSSIGWALPPPDGGSGGGNGVNPDTMYDIFIFNFFSRRNQIGFADPEGSYNDPLYPDSRTSWLGIENDVLDELPNISTEDRLKTLVAHELHHASQLRYTRHDFPTVYPAWFMENTSVWFEDIVYDDVNTLVERVNLPGQDPLNDPDVRINEINGTYEYAGGLWPTFLHEYYGANIVRRCWEIIGGVAGENTLSAIDSTLRFYYSSDLQSALKYYAVWRYFTGSRADSYHFSEGSTYDTAFILANHHSYPITGDENYKPPLSPGGTNYIVFDNPPVSNPITFDGSDNFSWGAMLIGDRGPSNMSFESEMGLNSSQAGTSIILTAGIDQIVLMPVNITWPYTGGVADHSYNASSTPSNVNVLDTMTAGWNLLSGPNYVSNFSKSSLYPTAISSAWTGMPYATQDPLHNGPGYWVKFPSTYNKTYTGKPFDVMWIPVNSGWNMIGSIAGSIDTLKIFPSKGTTRQSRYFGYNGFYSVASSLQSGSGYFVKVSGPGYLTYNATASLSAPPPSSIDPNPPIAPGQITAPTLNGSVSGGHPYLTWNTVSGGAEYRLYRYECEGASDCNLPGSLRYLGSGTSFMDVQIQVGNKFDPTTVWYYLRAVDAFGEVSVKSNKKSYWKDDSYQEKASAGIVQNENSAIPTYYELFTNFPNPFNPTTTIKYNLPENSYVQLEVYNTLGQKVATLVDDIQGAGYKIAAFDASDLPAGVYVYRLQAGNYVDVNKMILIK